MKYLHAVIMSTVNVQGETAYYSAGFSRGKPWTTLVELNSLTTRVVFTVQSPTCVQCDQRSAEHVHPWATRWSPESFILKSHQILLVLLIDESSFFNVFIYYNWETTTSGNFAVLFWRSKTVVWNPAKVIIVTLFCLVYVSEGFKNKTNKNNHGSARR